MSKTEKNIPQFQHCDVVESSPNEPVFILVKKEEYVHSRGRYSAVHDYYKSLFLRNKISSVRYLFSNKETLMRVRNIFKTCISKNPLYLCGGTACGISKRQVKITEDFNALYKFELV